MKTEVALLYYTALNIDLPTGILIGIMVTLKLRRITSSDTDLYYY